MTDIASLNIKIDTSDAKTAKNDLDKLTSSGKNAESQMGSMSNTAVKLGKALAAAFVSYKIAQFTQDVVMAAARYETLGVVMLKVGSNAGYTASQVTSFSNQIRESGIQMDTARQVTIRMIQAQIDMSKASQLARIAQDAAVIGHINSSEALERMVHGIQSAETEIMKGIGLNVSFEKSYKTLAKQLGVNKDSLTEQQKMQARVNETMEVAKAIAGSYEASMTTAGKQIDSFTRYIGDFKIEMGKAFNPATAQVVKSMTEAMKELTEAVSSPEIQSALGAIAQDFADWVSENKTLISQNLPEYIAGFETALKSMGSVAEGVFTVLTTLNSGMENLAINAKAAGMASGGAMSWGTFLTSTTNELKKAVADFDSSFDPKVVSKDFSSVFADHFKKAETATTAIVTASTTANTAAKKKGLTDQENALKASIEEQKRAIESFNDDYKKATLSTFGYEIAKLDEKYEYFKAQKVDEVRLEEWYAEEHFRINQEDIARFMDQHEKAKEEQKRVIESFDDDYKRVFLSTFEYEISKLDEKYEYFKSQKIDELRLEEWYAEEKLRIQNEADEEAKEKQQDAYDELYDGIYGFTRNVIDDWDDMGNTLVDMAESMVKDIIAAFVTQKIAIPIYMYAADMAGISTGLASGMSPSSGGLASMTSPISSLFTIGKTAYTLVTEGVSAAVSDLVGADLLGSISSAMFGETAATAAAMEFTTISPTVASTIESAYAVANGGTATTTSAASGMGAATAAGLAVAAFMAIDTFLGSHDEADPDIYVQSPTGGMTESTATYTVSNRDAVTDEIVTIFDAAFASLDESLDANIVDAVTASAFRGKARITDLDETDANALINSLVESAFSGDYTGAVFSLDGLFGQGGMENNSVKSDGEYMDYWNNTVTGFTKGLDGNYSKGLSDILMEAIGLNSDIFDFDFLKSLQAEGENLFDTFANFAIVVQETDGFVENITRQIDEFGFTVEEAFANILVVISVLDEIQASVDALATTSSVAALNTLTDSWYALIDSLEAAYATTTQITEAETAMAQVLGANITGLTADALQSALSEGSDIESILQTSIQNAAYADIAQKIAEEYISGINEQIGQVWIDTGGDLEAVAQAMQDIDTTEAQAALEELQESFGLLAESTNDALDTAEAMRIVTLAIEGQLTVAQKFEEWQISNIEAMNLFSEMAANSVTKDELESAVDAFADLGIEGDDLNNVIQDLADTFTAATQQMYENISDIESAQGELIGSEESTAAYLNSMKEVVDFFKDTPSLSEIRGDEQYLTTEFDEAGYKQAIADYVVNSEFQSILGRNSSSDYYQNALVEGSISLNDIHDAIVSGISSSEDTVNEIFNRLFGRSASGSYWSDALEDGLVSLSNLESSILAGASSSDLAYYNTNGGQVEITNWEDFETAAGIAGVSADDFYSQVINTNTGEFSTSEAEVEAALEILNSLPDILDSSGNLISSALDEFVNTVGTMDSAVLEDIFGSAAAAQISEMVSAISDYESSTGGDSGTSDSGSATDDTQDQIDAIFAQIQEGIDTINLSDFEKEIYDINKQAQEWTDSLAELGVTASEDLAIIEEWVTAQRNALAEGITEEWQNIINENTLSDTDLQLIELDAWFDEQKAAAEELGMSLDTLTEAYDLQKDAIVEIAKSDYLGYLQEEIDLRQSAYDEAKSVLEDYISDEEALIEARRAASESINEFIDGLMSSEDSPVQSLEYFEKRYAQLLSDAQNADADGITDAISNLTGFTSEYLDFAGAYGSQDYNSLFESVTNDLTALGVDQLTAADAQETALQDIKDLIEETGDSLFDLNAAVQEFVTAQASLNEAAWMQTELDTLSSIDDNLSLLYAAVNAYYGIIGQDVPDYAKPDVSGTALLTDIMNNSGIQVNDLVSKMLSAKLQQMIDNDTYSDLAASSLVMGASSQFRESTNIGDLLALFETYSNNYSFADGGIASGPLTGYQATLHGTEAIIPLNSGSIPIEIKNGEQNITVVVKVGNRELKDITTEIIRTDSEAQKQIRRVANG